MLSAAQALVSQINEKIGPQRSWRTGLPRRTTQEDYPGGLPRRTTLTHLSLFGAWLFAWIHSLRFACVANETAASDTRRFNPLRLSCLSANIFGICSIIRPIAQQEQTCATRQQSNRQQSQAANTL
jgi:hypothetical protein